MCWLCNVRVRQLAFEDEAEADADPDAGVTNETGDVPRATAVASDDPTTSPAADSR